MLSCSSLGETGSEVARWTGPGGEVDGGRETGLWDAGRHGSYSFGEKNKRLFWEGYAAAKWRCCF